MLLKSSYLIHASLLLSFVIFTGCSGGAGEATTNEENSSPNVSADTNVVEADQSQPRKMPKLRRDGNNLAIAYLNVESGGNDPARVVRDLTDIGRFHIFALTEVDKVKVFSDTIKDEWDGFDVFEGKSGRNKEEPDDHSVIIYDARRLYRVDKYEIEVESESLKDESVPRPLVAHFREKSDDSEFYFILTHFHTDPALQMEQAKAVTEWVKNKPQPAIAVGSFNFAYNTQNDEGDDSFKSFTKDGTWQWLKPTKLMDTQWTDGDGDGKDDQADTLTDFAFVSGQAKKWDANCNILGDKDALPDDEATSNHRPIEVLLRRK